MDLETEYNYRAEPHCRGLDNAFSVVEGFFSLLGLKSEFLKCLRWFIHHILLLVCLVLISFE